MYFIFHTKGMHVRAEQVTAMENGKKRRDRGRAGWAVINTDLYALSK